MMPRIALAAAVASLLTAAFVTTSVAQQPPVPAPAPSDKVIVEGISPEEAVRSFIDEVSAAPPGRNLARWDRKVCVGAINLATRYAQRLIDQVSTVAISVGLEAGEPGCHPDVLILAYSDGDALATRLVKDRFRSFRPDSDSTQLGQAALSRFRTAHTPVRWWHVSQTIAADGGQASLGDPAFPALGDSIYNVHEASRLRINVREEMAHVIIVLDTTLIGKTSFASLADYVAMVALAQIDAKADTHEFPTILNLFAAETGEREARMTQWDLDYLKALYEARGDAARPAGQEREIAGEMLKREPKSAN